MKNFKFLLPALFYFACVFVSCQKELNPIITIPKTDSASIAGFKDSTLLIRSINKIFYDSATNNVTDSFTEYYFYDTLNKKIIISFQPVSNSTQSYDGYEFNYNNKGLLSHEVDKFYTSLPDSNSVYSKDYIYDASNIIKACVIKYYFSSNYDTISYNKTILSSGGYQLNWVTIIPNYGTAQDDTCYNQLNFNSIGKLQYYKLGHGYFNKASWQDSLSYDLNGNVNKIYTSNFFYQNPPFNGLADSTDTYVAYNFISRDIKGNQLYNLNQIIYKGIAEMPSGFDDQSLNSSIDDYAYQYSKYPALSTKVFLKNRSNGIDYFGLFNPTPQYDNLNRLTKYRLFFNDAQTYYYDWTIHYYK